MGIFGVIVIIIAAAWIIALIWAMKTEKEQVMLKRSAIWGSLITGFAGWIFAINSMLGGEEIGAGICLFASAAAFGIIAFLATRK
ncbi:hypothetical protein ACFLUQ_00410 [Chloroflexota bacterium]